VRQVINSSPGNLAPVFDAMLEKAMQLCEAAFGELGTYDGERFEVVAHRGVPPPYAQYARGKRNYGPGTGPALILEGERVVHVLDLKSTEVYARGEPARAIVDLGGARTFLLVPLLKDEDVVGFITIYRQEVRPFTEKPSRSPPGQRSSAKAKFADL
jgi:two-component system NtrC family sensor kinase